MDKVKPMQVNTYHLSPEERNRRMVWRLFMLRSTRPYASLMPISPESWSAENAEFLSIPQTLKCVKVPITLNIDGHCITTSALLESGAAGNFMSQGFSLKNQITLIKFSSSLTVEAIDGRLLGTGLISATTKELMMQTGILHTENIQFYILPISTITIIPGLPWLRRHNPDISWRDGQITHWNKNCCKTCLTNKFSMPLRNISLPNSIPELPLPAEYRDLAEAFSKTNASKLPPHCPYDYPIDLHPGTPPPRGRIFPLSQPESDSMKAYIEEELSKGFIRPSTSPASTGFLFGSFFRTAKFFTKLISPGLLTLSRPSNSLRNALHRLPSSTTLIQILHLW